MIETKLLVFSKNNTGNRLDWIAVINVFNTESVL
jgi:hypothetical protein